MKVLDLGKFLAFANGKPAGAREPHDFVSTTIRSIHVADAGTDRQVGLLAISRQSRKKTFPCIPGFPA
jgi:hypothetical protein